MPVAGTSKKRQLGASETAPSKRARLALNDTSVTVKSILADPDGFHVPITDDATRKLFHDIALYAESLEKEVEAYKPKAKTAEQLKDAVDKLRAAARSGILKQMTPSCKTGGARWVYDGVCSDPEVFGALLGLDGPPTFKTKKFPKNDFSTLFHRLRGSARYNELYLLADVNVHWKPADGTFKFSGTYGVPKY